MPIDSMTRSRNAYRFDLVMCVAPESGVQPGRDQDHQATAADHEEPGIRGQLQGQAGPGGLRIQGNHDQL